MKENKTKKLVLGLIAIIVILLGFVIYSFVVRPVVARYTDNARNEGLQFAIASIMQQAATCQPVPLTFGDQTINVIDVNCLS
jgi:glucose uptake protein GlcU